ncbi:NAD(P)-dependent oxidoreductase [Paraferrimonas sp. SM1919]|uniref:NAD-dependent epimerase/dehydratase family protein n=1 Tax=Paraferrimonas sp. SM1919 TaxID=2662263 RepID=UPI001969F293|nr:NAD-dependent epimerase/dehydratase family protein [Paraferrimonas sp. SM1919]
MMNIVVIGGSGFIGTRLIDRLINNQDLSIQILDKVTSGKYPQLSKVCDMTSVESLREGLNENVDVVINLAAEHKDNVSPVSLYYDVNVEGQKNLCKVMDEYGIKKMVFTSSVAVYGFVTEDTGESGAINPFNDYGKSKYQAELATHDWLDDSKQFSVIRPTVVFGEGNRGNVYNLLRQIASGKFLMIGKGENQKSMAYVENVAAFIEHLVFNGKGHQVFNYIDKPDFNMNKLVSVVNSALGKTGSVLRLPYWLGLLAGYGFDLLAKLTGKELPVSSIRVKKFCARTQFKSNTDYLGFIAPVSLEQGLSNTVKNEFTKK